MTLKEKILAARDHKTAPVKVPEWNVELTIRSFSAEERDAWEQQVQAAAKTGIPVENFRAKLAAKIVIDKDGARVFSDDDVEALGKKSGAALDRIFGAFLKLNALSKKEVDELQKN